jgi:hypothetical protein
MAADETTEGAGPNRKAALYMQHPDTSPDEIVGRPDYLIHPPSRLAPTARWIDFRDRTVLPMIEGRPDDPDLPNYLKQVEIVLAWRAAIAPKDRFWKPDP